MKGCWRRVKLTVRPQTQEEQCRFCPGHGALDQLYTLTTVLKGGWEFAHPVHMFLVDSWCILCGDTHGVCGTGSVAMGHSVSIQAEQEFGLQYR